MYISDYRLTFLVSGASYEASFLSIVIDKFSSVVLVADNQSNEALFEVVKLHQLERQEFNS